MTQCVERLGHAGWALVPGAPLFVAAERGGMASTFRELGFVEVGVAGKNRAQARLVMRYEVGGVAMA